MQIGKKGGTMETFIRVVVINFISYIVITTIVDFWCMGVITPHISFKWNVNEYIIKRKNKIDIQTEYQCSAFSVAYILRHWGIQANGRDIYPIMPDKMKGGYVYPKGLLHLLRKYGFQVKYYSGNLKALQREICKGNPVIVMIRVRADKNWLHYVPVVGYDKEYVFIAESLEELVNCDCKFYNRRVEKKEFLRLWNTSMIRQPLYKNTYMVVKKK